MVLKESLYCRTQSSIIKCFKMTKLDSVYFLIRSIIYKNTTIGTPIESFSQTPKSLLASRIHNLIYLIFTNKLATFPSTATSVSNMSAPIVAL